MPQPIHNTRGNDEADAEYHNKVRQNIIGQLQRKGGYQMPKDGRPKSEDGDRDETEG